ncbi:MAG: sulfatase-like hydrolase/transferase [Fuerstiella sp.]|nr:sulfatase-like hydrolase/transferase [Fuerstiella sp.]
MKNDTTLVVYSAVALLCASNAHGAEQSDRPNILYIALEDITPMMSCYGDTYAKTPNFDKLAEEGIRYINAHAVAPVCSVSRSSIVTGMYPSTIGTMHHRSGGVPAPAILKFVPNLMSDAGYYTTNHKGDYNIVGMKYDRQGKKGGDTPWRSRPDKSQLFFSKVDFGECHSSVTKTSEDVVVKARLNRLRPSDFHDPARAPIPSYHPDDPVFRKAWARYYDAVTQVDYRAGEVFAALKEDGLWDDTIIIVWADHGVGMPRGKHTAWEQGTHVPLIVRFPAKYQHLAPAKPGAVVDDLVCLMDMAPSVLTFAGIKPPDHMQGRALLCKGDAQEREFLVAVRNRLDTRTQFVRSIRDKRYRYMRHFYPHRPYAPYETYQWEAPIYDRFQQLALAGKLKGPQAEYAQRFKAVEQLYDSENDPEMVHNLAGDPAYADVLKQMRQRLYDWMIETRDLALVEERELYKRAKGRSLWAVGQEIENYERILETANLQLQGEFALAELKTRSADADPWVRYWAVLGLMVITQTAESEVVAEILPSLNKSLTDESIDVRLLAAEGLFNLGYYKRALPVVLAEMAHPNTDVQVRVGNILDSQPPDANEQLASAIEPLAVAMRKFKPSGRYGGQNKPFERAYRAITGQQLYFRWGMGASGSPKSPLIAVQKKPFVAKPASRVTPQPGNRKRKRSEPSTLKAIGGKIVEVSSFHPGHEPDHMLDGDPATFWHTRFKPEFAERPHFVVLQVPADKPIAGLAYIPRTKPNGRVLSYKVSVSNDGRTWSNSVANGRFGANATVRNEIKFTEPTGRRFIKLAVTDAVSAGGQSIAAIGELDVLTD